MRKSPVLTALLFVSSPLFAADDLAPNAAIITSNSAEITVLDMEALLVGAPGPSKYKLFTNPEQVKLVMEKELMTKLMAQEARKLGLADDPLRQTIMEAKVNEYLAGLRRQALDEEPVPDMSAAAREYYIAHPEEYSTQTMVHASHILVRTKDRTGEVRSEAEARELIAKLRERALAGEEFGTLAAEHSEDPSAKRNNGDLGYFPKGRMVKAFEEAAFAMTEPGAISDIVQSDFGFHILKLHARQEGELKPFEEVSAGIIQKLETDYRQNRRQEYVDRLKTSSEPLLYEDIFEDYVARKRAEMGIGTDKGTGEPESAE